MSHNITVEGGQSVRLPTSGKYCEQDIIVTAEDNYGEGYGDGLIDGEEKVKTEEARDSGDVIAFVEVDNRNVEVAVTAGYYPNETILNVDVQDVYAYIT